MNKELRVNEDLLREAFVREWIKTWNDPNQPFAGQSIPDVMQQLTKEVVERVLKSFRP